VKAVLVLTNKTKSIYDNVTLIQDNISQTAQEIRLLSEENRNSANQAAVVNMNSSAMYADSSRR
ncbi:MAG: hypothetical protein WB392_06415, partial [Methanotrichaceae archaeon]